MNIQAEHLLQTALGLPLNDRAEIAVSLIQSLDEEADANVDAAWAVEIKQRIESIDNRQVTLIPWEEVLREMRERLDGCQPSNST